MAKVLIPTPLRQFTEKHDSVQLEGGSVSEVLTELVSKFPDLRKQIFNDEGKLRSFVNVYLNDDDIRYLEKEATTVVSTDTLSIVPSASPAVRPDIAEPPAASTSKKRRCQKKRSLRYSRHLTAMPEVGMEGQLKLKKAKVLLVGAGGLGAPLGLYLSAMLGIGRIGVVDFDVVDFTNLSTPGEFTRTQGCRAQEAGFGRRHDARH